MILRIRRLEHTLTRQGSFAELCRTSYMLSSVAAAPGKCTVGKFTLDYSRVTQWGSSLPHGCKTHAKHCQTVSLQLALLKSVRQAPRQGVSSPSVTEPQRSPTLLPARRAFCGGVSLVYNRLSDLGSAPLTHPINASHRSIR